MKINFRLTTRLGRDYLFIINNTHRLEHREEKPVVVIETRETLMPSELVNVALFYFRR